MVPYNAQRQAEGLPPTQRRPAREGARPGAAGAHCGRDRPAMRQRLSLCFLLWPLLFITSCLSLPVLFLFLFFFSPIFIFGLQFTGVNWVLSIFPKAPQEEFSQPSQEALSPCPGLARGGVSITGPARQGHLWLPSGQPCALPACP